MGFTALLLPLIASALHNHILNTVKIAQWHAAVTLIDLDLAQNGDIVAWQGGDVDLEQWQTWVQEGLVEYLLLLC